MFTRITPRFAIAFLLAAVLFTLGVKKFEARNVSPQQDRFIAHEWGTFTSVSAADGEAQYWYPLTGPSELPSFVYRSEEARRGQCVKCNLALVRMETPVIYFYSDRDLNVSVKVGFPKGRITEWYPQARVADQGISWGGLAVRPRAKENFPVDQSRSHYYPARETDAAPISLGDEQKVEQEKFLFYRGLGSFDLPLSVRLKGNEVVVHNTGRDEITQVILFENREGKLGWRIHGALKGEAVIARPALDQTAESLRREIEKVLVAQGLYEKEAVAMVNTWRDSWFEEGLRIFYTVPRKTTDTVLPITITPAPAELRRALVGRAEVITPEMELAIQAAVDQFGEGTDESRAAAVKSVRRFGRFAEPVLRRMMQRSNNNSVESPVWKLLTASTF
jgi:hypothetical protein